LLDDLSGFSDLPMKLRSFFLTLAAFVLVLLLLGTGGFVWVFAHSPLGLLTGGQDTTPRAAMFISRQAPVMVSLLVTPDQLGDVRQVVARPKDRRQTRAELEQLKRSVLATTGLDYDQDIQPWLGNELTVAVTTPDIDRDRANGQQPGYLLAIATRDPQRSREFLQLFWQKQAIAGTDLVFEQYNGVKLISGNSPGRSTDNATLKTPGSSPLASTLASAAVGDQFILFANHPKVLRDAINNVQASDLSLTSADVYDQALQTLTRPRIGLAVVNLPRLADWLGESPSVGTNPPTSGSLESAPTYETLAIALELQPSGLMAETAFVPTQNQGVSATPAFAPTLSEPVGALRYIPVSSPFSASGTNLDHLWHQISKGLTGYDTIAQLIHLPVNDLQTRWAINLPDNIFSTVTGEYALGLIPVVGQPSEQKRPSSRRSQSPSTTDWIFVAPRSQMNARAIAHLDEIAKAQGLSVGSLTLGDQTISAWTRLSAASSKTTASQTLQADVRGVHTSIDNYEIFATSIAAMDQALHAVDHSLGDSTSFQQATEPFLKPNHGYLYVDWPTSVPILERQFPLFKVAELAGKPLFDHLRSLTISAYGSDAGIQRGGVFLRLD
jgi:hypothetical protein